MRYESAHHAGGTPSRRTNLQGFQAFAKLRLHRARHHAQPARPLISYTVRSLKVIACLEPKAKPYRREKEVTMHRMHAALPEQHTSNSRVYTISKHLFQLHDRTAFIPPLFH